MTTVPGHVFDAYGSVLMQECVRNFLNREDLQCVSPFQGEVRRFRPRTYMPLFAHWKSAWAALAQDYFVLLSFTSDRAEVCICISSITDVRIQEDAGIAEENDYDVGSGVSSSSAVELSCCWSPGVASSPGSYSAAASPGLRGRGHRRNAGRSPPLGTFRITYLAGSRQKHVLLGAENNREWARTIANALVSRRMGEPIFRSFVLIEDLRSWAEQAAVSRALSGSGSIVENRASQANLACVLSTVTLLMKSLQESAKHRAFLAMKYQARRARLQDSAATRIESCLARIFKRVAFSKVLASWHRLRPRTAGCSCAHHRSAPEALAQALVEAWDPLWASRVILLQRALQRLVRAAIQAPWRRLCAQVALRPALTIGMTEESASRASASACCHCLVLVIQRSIKRRLGHSLRILACAGAQKGMAEALEALELSFVGIEDCMYQSSDPTA